MRRKRIGGRKSEPTQLEAIRDLMLKTSRRGHWLTLAEIAERTEFGATSISAQLRHLRKKRFGRYRVEKRMRRMSGGKTVRALGRRMLHAIFAGEARWEYGVFPGINTLSGKGPGREGAACEAAARRRSRRAKHSRLRAA